MDDILKDIQGDFDYDLTNWAPIRAEAKKDMQFVAGNPWDEADKKARENRPTVAPEEMSQYRNQVINSLMANPRGGKFSPTGNGANDKGAQFYQNKWREIEYRSHATHAYNLAAENALQRSYGFVRVKYDYASPRSVNKEIWIEGFPNPDMVLPDTDAVMYDGSDMTRCVVHQWIDQKVFERRYPKAKITSFGTFATEHPNWIKGQRILLAEAWRIKTRKRQLLLVTPPAPMAPPRMIAPSPVKPPEPQQVFKDELDLAGLPPGSQIQELREVDYPSVCMYLVNGVEQLEDEHEWPGQYIPIVSCYGKVLFMDGDEGMERLIMSMTRFGRDPWKSYCYACSQELEILAQVPKASVVAAAGQLKGFENDWTEAHYKPKGWLYYHATTEGTGQQPLPPPQRLAYLQGDNLQAIEIVKEGFRRAIQSAMGSNFLPTQAQKRNEKSGVALDKIDQMAAQGTYHFVYAYEGMIRQTAVIGEDLMDKIYDFRGDISVIEADSTAVQVSVNDPDNPKAISTKGDYLVTVSTAPSSDSEREAADEFLGALIGQLERIAGVAGPEIARAIFAKAIRMRNLGPQGDQIADLMEPEEFKAKDGDEPPKPEMVAANMKIKQLMGVLQQAAQERDAKVVETQGKFAIEKMKVDSTSQDKAADREVKLAVAALQADIAGLKLFIEERARLGMQGHEAAMGARDLLHDSMESERNRQQASEDSAQSRRHELGMSGVGHRQALERGAQGQQFALEQADIGHEQALEQGEQATEGALAVQAAKPVPTNGASA